MYVPCDVRMVQSWSICTVCNKVIMVKSWFITDMETVRNHHSCTGDLARKFAPVVWFFCPSLWRTMANKQLPASIAPGKWRTGAWDWNRCLVCSRSAASTYRCVTRTAAPPEEAMNLLDVLGEGAALWRCLRKHLASADAIFVFCWRFWKTIARGPFWSGRTMRRNAVRIFISGEIVNTMIPGGSM